MKKIIWLLTLGFLIVNLVGLMNPPVLQAKSLALVNDTSIQNVKDVIGTITPPKELNDIVNNPNGTPRNGNEALGLVVSNLVKIIYAIAGIIFLFLLIFGAIGWMTAGGNKEALQSAQKRIMNAIIGFVLLAAAALIANLVGNLTGFGKLVG